MTIIFILRVDMIRILKSRWIKVFLKLFFPRLKKHHVLTIYFENYDIALTSMRGQSLTEAASQGRGGAVSIDKRGRPNRVGRGSFRAIPDLEPWTRHPRNLIILQ